MSIKYVDFFNKYDAFIRRSALETNLVTIFLIYAITHVIQYNILLSKNSEKIYFMEDIIADPKTFINEIGVGAGNKYKLEL